MDKKDLLAIELKSVMEEESEGMELSQNIINNIMNSRELTLKDKINNFLNHEIEIPIAPAVVGFAALLFITSIPKDIFKNTETRVINIGSSQVYIKEKEVSWK